MQSYFHALSDVAQAALTGDEVFTANFYGEDSDFARFNHNEVRQAGHVTQRELSLDLIEGARHASGEIALSGVLEEDGPRVQALIRQLREVRGHLPEDPYLLYNTEVQSSERIAEDALPELDQALDQIRAAGDSKDLVGVYAVGGIHAGFANSLGQRNWASTFSHNVDWSFYHEADRAVKQGYAGLTWDAEAFGAKVALASQQLEALAREPKTVEPGRYRVYLTPAALHEVLELLASGAFSLKAHKTKQTPLLRMVEGESRLGAGVRLSEDTVHGVGPNFQSEGFLKPDEVPLIVDGAYRDCLISPRSAREFGVETNGADGSESPSAIAMAPGELPRAEILQELGTGVYVGNLWYMNFSDRSACRTTGMTRFATFWVEDGEIVAPLKVMRFDETIYRMLGENLRGLTQERDLILDSGTYFRRSTGSAHLPGALVEDFTFTL